MVRESCLSPGSTEGIGIDLYQRLADVTGVTVSTVSSATGEAGGVSLASS